jgi:hypothetical protein
LKMKMRGTGVMLAKKTTMITMTVWSFRKGAEKTNK